MQAIINLRKTPIAAALVYIFGIQIAVAQQEVESAKKLGYFSGPTKEKEAQDLDAVSVIGARGQSRTITDSPVPIELVSEEEIQGTGVQDTNDILKTLVPSYTVERNANSDAASFVRPASMRGLPPDKTLLLVNGKRRHRSAAVYTNGYGAQPMDAAMIPSAAIKTIEVLKDGAAAQYGSDAIAGVLNFVLRDDNSGGGYSISSGRYYEGDGDTLSISGWQGFSIGKTGFLNASFEYINQERTSRAQQYENSAFSVVEYAAQNPDYANWVGDLNDPVNKVGQPQTEGTRVFLNSGFDVNDTDKFYAFGNFSKVRTTTIANYRYPTGGQEVNDVPVRLEDGTVWRFNEVFPYGFIPNYGAAIKDYSVVMGYKGVWDDFDYDISARYGKNHIRNFVSDMVNPTLGMWSPHSFSNRSSYASDDLAFNADFSYSKDWGKFYGPVVFAFGAEWRREGFELIKGEKSAWEVGPYASPDPWGFCAEGAVAPAGVNCDDPDDPVYNTLPSLTLIVNDEMAGRYTRSNYSFYGEMSSDITERLFIDAAARFEDYQDFGSTTIGKLAGSYKISENIHLRGSIGTGFRAPTTGQLHMTNVQVVSDDGVAKTGGLFPATHAVSKYLGAKPLDPEKSTSYTFGVTGDFDNGLGFTLDFYKIDIRGQIYSTKSITVTDEILAAMETAGVNGADSISKINFFQNAFDTSATGIDLIVSDKIKWGDSVFTDLTFSANHNKYKIKKIKIADLIDEEGKFDFENALPRWKGVVTADHHWGKFNAMVRSTVWGPYKNMYSASNPIIQKFNPEVFWDMELGYEISDKYKISIGGRNIFDNYPAPDKIGETSINGRIYRSDSVVDWQGGYYYIRFDAKF